MQDALTQRGSVRSGVVRNQLPGTLKEIGARAFVGRSQLSEVQFPRGFARVGKSAFHGWSLLQRIDLSRLAPGAEIGEYAFSKSGIVEIEVPGTVQTIGGRALHDCDFLKVI
jgi:hypothetical protein